MLLQGVVIAGLAKTVATAFALYLLPNGRSKMIRNRVKEKFSVSGRYAEIGMKAANAAAQFARLDHDHTGEIHLWELCNNFAKLRGVTFEQAYAVATLVLDGADKSVKSAPVSDGSIDFDEFLRAMEGGNMIKFDKYLKIAVLQASKLQSAIPADVRTKCLLAFADGKAECAAADTAHSEAFPPEQVGVNNTRLAY